MRNRIPRANTSPSLLHLVPDFHPKNSRSISLIDRLIALFACVSSPSLRPLALQILVEKRITGFPVVDADWNLP
ncbi:hypothetical protein L1987_70953 [Smallanthus sonchifolius]|uniref:Uncharacterized protein n=1 Tax=Smallanthus sonchifolius TaxID=185202 RepID=A0ACB9AQH1_9ASTR|nr:hypothetical protein L1987_70953 [Smallanthus sonchifolius]